MQYLKSTFVVSGENSKTARKNFAEGWDRTFGKAKKERREQPARESESNGK
jgi:hypothetical protein